MRKHLLAFVILATAACGGSEKKPSLTPEDTVKTASTETPKEDMPPPSKDPALDPTTPDKPAVEAPKEGGAIKVAAFKLVPSKKNAKALELKADGSIVADGKTVATIKGDQVNEPSGTTMVTVGVDGSLVGQNVKAGWKFVGDDLTNDDGSKVAVADDGAVTWTKKDGKSETVGKIEGGTSAKRAALLSVLLWVSTATATAAPPAKPAGKPATKPATKPKK